MISKSVTQGRPHSRNKLIELRAADLHPPETASRNANRLDRCLTELAQSRQRYAETTVGPRIELAESCLRGVMLTAREWVDAACRAKEMPPNSPVRAEEIIAGPVAAARYLRLLIDSLRDIETHGVPQLPGPATEGPDGRLRVPVMPARGCFDPLVFIGFKAHVRMQEGVTRKNLSDHLAAHYRDRRDEPAKIALVLGAGNVSSIPAIDAFTKLFQEGKVVLLKMHPVNDYLGPIFQRAFADPIDDGYLRIIDGDAGVGACAVHHNLVDEVHITGGVDAHDRIVWGPEGQDRERRQRENQPVLAKPISSELGNVSPWIIVPGPYSDRQLKFQAENIVASITNNASFNCVTTRVLITWKHWPQRERFLGMVQQMLAEVPARKAYYPGALERFRRFSGSEPLDTDRLPWTLIQDVDPNESPHFLNEESFVCVAAEVALDGASEEDFLHRSVDFANERLWGTLCAAVTVHPRSRRGLGRLELFESFLNRLQYGMVGINQWPALIYSLMGPPWGAYPGGTLANVQSGIGWVHNTYMLESIEKTILESPLVGFPRPIWFPSYNNPAPVAWKLLELYQRPTFWNYSKLLYQSIKTMYVPLRSVPKRDTDPASSTRISIHSVQEEC